jgi:hypothetical protein
MILARSSPDLSQEDEASKAPSPVAECAPINPAPHEHDYAELPSFRPLSRRPTDAPKTSEKASLREEQSDGRAIVTSNPRAIACSSIGAGAVAKRVDGPLDEGSRYRVPGLVEPPRRILLLCCVFLSGVAAGLGGAHLASSVTGFQDVGTALSSVTKAVASVTGMITMDPVSSETLVPTEASVSSSRRREVPFLRQDPALSLELFAKGSQLSAPTEPSERSIESLPRDDAVEAVHQGDDALPDQHPEQPRASSADARASGYSDEGELHGGIPRLDALPPQAAAGDHSAEAVHLPTNEAFVSLGLTRGDEAMARGDIVAARHFYELAASYQSASAATAVGRTYDPIYLNETGVRGLQPDAQKARYWYKRAQQQGDSEARVRLALLDHME